MTPTVWHKEILWAMAQGIHVFGGASIGALRAAELDVFGMKGIGRIYEDFRDGVLTGRRRSRGPARPRGARLSAADRGDGQHPRHACRSERSCIPTQSQRPA